MSLLSSNFIKLRRKVRKFIHPIGNVALVLTLLWIPYLSLFGNETEVDEHGYLNKYSINELLYRDFESLEHIRTKLLESPKVDRKSRAESAEKQTSDSEVASSTAQSSSFTRVPPEGCPNLLRRCGELLKENVPTLEMLYSKFSCVYDKGGINRIIKGNYVLSRLKCNRCTSKGSTLIVSTVGSEEDISSVALGISILKHLENVEYLSQDLLFLIVERGLPYATGTRQFLKDYFNNEDFPLRSHLIHNALVLDLGCNDCLKYMISYEGMNGSLPNQDVINMFTKISDSEGLTVATRPMWHSIFRMAFNVDNGRHHIPLLDKNINSFSIVCSIPTRQKTKLDLLYKALTLAVRNQNNLDTVLERSYNFYFLVDPTHFISISTYIPIIPLLLLKPILFVFFSDYVNKFATILVGLAIFIVNSLLGAIPSYIYLIRIIKKFSKINELSLSETRNAITLLAGSFALLFVLNVVFFKVYESSFNCADTSEEDEEEELLVKEELIKKILASKSLDSTRGTLLTKFSFFCANNPFKLNSNDKNHCTSTFTTNLTDLSKVTEPKDEKLGTRRKSRINGTTTTDTEGDATVDGETSLVAKSRFNSKLENNQHVPILNEESSKKSSWATRLSFIKETLLGKNKATSDTSDGYSEGLHLPVINRHTSSTDGTAPSCINASDDLGILKNRLDSMGGACVIYPISKQLPPVDVILSCSTLIVSIGFLIGLSILNWPLAFVLSLLEALPLGLLRITKKTSITRPLVTFAYIGLFLFLIYPPASAHSARDQAFYIISYVCGCISRLLGHSILNKYTAPFKVLFIFLERSVFSNNTHWINSAAEEFLLRKLYKLTEDHIFFGSHTLPILLFYAVPTLFHCALTNFYLLTRFFKRKR